MCDIPDQHDSKFATIMHLASELWSSEQDFVVVFLRTLISSRREQLAVEIAELERLAAESDAEFAAETEARAAADAEEMQFVM